MTRRLTMLHVLWDDEGTPPEPQDWPQILGRALVVHEAIVAAEIEVPSDAVVFVHPCGRVEITSEDLDIDIQTTREEGPSSG